MDEVDGFATSLRRAQLGDERALAEIYRSHHGRLLRMLGSEVGDEAEDIASQTWFEVFGALGRFEGDQRRFRSFLYTVARRRVADHRRARWRRPTTSVEPEVLHATPDRSGLLDQGVADGLDGEAAVRRIVEILGEDSARVVLLRVVGGLGVGEVAAIVGRSSGAVRVQQHRALKKLAAALARERGDAL